MTPHPETFAAMPLGLNNGRSFAESFAGHRVVAVIPFNEKIAYVSLARGKVSSEGATQETPVPNHVIVDLFSPPGLADLFAMC
ncbi:MAG: hypothetical protein LBE62_14905 [Azonexus sp.]|jgi:hypothetical protein|nr:hypothetical protein [Azonexus sp.]